MKWALFFYLMAFLAFVAGAFNVVETLDGSTNTAFTLGAGLYFFVGILALTGGNAFWVLNRRLRAIERAEQDARRFLRR
jgi:hypothetical protein